MCTLVVRVHRGDVVEVQTRVSGFMPRVSMPRASETEDV
jgi:hypothetical protein